MRALVLAILLFLVAAAPAQAATAQAAPARDTAMDYWEYKATYATEQECVEEGGKIPEGVDYYVCRPEDGAWDLYWVFYT